MAAPDAELVRRTLAGDTEAYGDLVLRHADFVHGLVYGILGHRDDALETVQAVFVRAFERLPRLRDPERFRPWLGLIATSQAKNRRRARRDVAMGELPDRPSDAAEPLGTLLEAEERRRVRTALARIPEKNRIVLLLRYQGGLGYEEIAGQLGLAVTTVRSRIHEGKKMLRGLLETPGAGPNPAGRTTRKTR